MTWRHLRVRELLRVRIGRRVAHRLVRPLLFSNPGRLIGGKIARPVLAQLMGGVFDLRRRKAKVLCDEGPLIQFRYPCRTPGFDYREEQLHRLHHAPANDRHHIDGQASGMHEGL